MQEVVLSIEAAIAGGSISLIRERAEIAHWIGTGNISKAENLLGDIDRLLRENDIERSQIGLVAVSAGPGSFTGIRIGIATALGLKNGLGVEMASVSALEAMVYAADLPGKVTVAVPVGRGSVCVQEFDGGAPAGLPHVVAEDEFASALPESTMLLHGSLFEKFCGQPHAIDAGHNIALAVGLYAANRRTVVEPLFVSKATI